MGVNHGARQAETSTIMKETNMKNWTPPVAAKHRADGQLKPAMKLTPPLVKAPVPIKRKARVKP